MAKLQEGQLVHQRHRAGFHGAGGDQEHRRTDDEGIG